MIDKKSWKKIGLLVAVLGLIGLSLSFLRELIFITKFSYLLTFVGLFMFVWNSPEVSEFGLAGFFKLKRVVRKLEENLEAEVKISTEMQDYIGERSSNHILSMI